MPMETKLWSNILLKRMEQKQRYEQSSCMAIPHSHHSVAHTKSQSAQEECSSKQKSCGAKGMKKEYV